MVYNVTPYMDYHPGGEEELMKAAGIDGTDLFDQVCKVYEMSCNIIWTDYKLSSLSFWNIDVNYYVIWIRFGLID